MATLRLLDQLCRGSGSCNEDAVIHAERWAAVFDGASPLAGSITPACSDATWFVGQLCRDLPARLTEPGPDLAAALGETLAGILPDYLAFAGAGTVPAYGVPSAGAVLVRIVGEKLQLLRIGDCSLVLGLSNGGYLTMADDLLPVLDANAQDAMVELANRRGTDVRAARPLIDELLVANRQRMNEPGGYWILEPRGRGAAHATLLELPLADIDDMLLMSDGFSAAHDTLHLAQDAPGLLRLVRERGIDAVYREIEAGFAADPGWNAYPRFKQIDDISALHLRVEHG